VRLHIGGTGAVPAINPQWLAIVPRNCITFRDALLFYGWEVVTSTTQPGGLPRVGRPGLLIQYINRYRSYLEVFSSVYKLRTSPVVVTRQYSYHGHLRDIKFILSTRHVRSAGTEVCLSSVAGVVSSPLHQVSPICTDWKLKAERFVGKPDWKTTRKI
jgi:hypothetical protein